MPNNKEIRTYTGLCQFSTFESRLRYLELGNAVGSGTFIWDRWLEEEFYKNDPEWKEVRRDAILRDKACNLGLEGYEINNGIIVHHMNVITTEDILNRTPFLLDLEYLICVNDKVHRAIHYGIPSQNELLNKMAERRPGDTTPWKKAY